MDQTLLLFDIDGTLLTSGGAGSFAMQQAGEQLFGPAFTFDGINFNGKLDPLIFAEAASQNELADHLEHHDRFRETYAEALGMALVRQAHAVRTLPGIDALLGMLRARRQAQGDVILGLLTGNYRTTAPLKLEAAGIDPTWFEITAFGDDGPTRPDLTAFALRRYHEIHGRAADPTRVVVIGDTPFDVQCAKAHDCVAFAVATGHYDMQTLADAGADLVVPDLADAGPLLNLLGS